MESAARLLDSRLLKSSRLIAAKLVIFSTWSATVYIFLVEIEGNFIRLSWAVTLYFTSLLVESVDVIVRALSTSGCGAPRLRSLNNAAVPWELWHQRSLRLVKCNVSKASLDWMSLIDISCWRLKFFYKQKNSCVQKSIWHMYKVRRTLFSYIRIYISSLTGSLIGISISIRYT